VGLCGLEVPRCYGLVTLLRVKPVMLEHVVPADGPAAAVGVVTVGAGRAVAVGQGHGRAVAGDVPGIAFNVRR